MNIKLIEDPDPPPHLPTTEGKTLKSTALRDDSGQTITLEGFDAISNKVGTSTYFVYDQFKFGGVLQRMQRAESVSGGRTLDLVLESPSKLMDGVQVIIGEFNGMTDKFLSTGAFGNTSSTNLDAKIVLYGPDRAINGQAVILPVCKLD